MTLSEHTYMSAVFLLLSALIALIVSVGGGLDARSGVLSRSVNGPELQIWVQGESPGGARG